MSGLAGVRRGVSDVGAASGFFSWLLEIEPIEAGECVVFACANGEFVLDGNTERPVGIVLDGLPVGFEGADPDGVVVTAALAPRNIDASKVRLDHVRLNCADLRATADFYCRFGFGFTWSGRGDAERQGLQHAPMERADWVHLSGDDGYLSLSQADWRSYGVHSAASGPPRFMHIGFAVPDISRVVARLCDAGVGYRDGAPAVGSNVYVNDPDGVPDLGPNVELIQYSPNLERSGARNARTVRTSGG